MDTHPLIEIIEVDVTQKNIVATEHQQATTPAHTAFPPASPTTPSQGRIYRLHPNVKDRIKHLVLPKSCWEILHQVDGIRTTKELSKLMGVPEAETATKCDRMLVMGLLIEKDTMTYAQFKKERKDIAEEKPVNQPKPVAEKFEHEASLHRTPGEQSAALIEHPKLLSCLTNLVRQSRGGGRRGELAVYLMFTRVPAELFRKAGVRSYLYMDENTELDDRVLALRLIKEAELIVGHAVGDELSKCLNPPDTNS